MRTDRDAFRIFLKSVATDRSAVTRILTAYEPFFAAADIGIFPLMPLSTTQGVTRAIRDATGTAVRHVIPLMPDGPKEVWFTMNGQSALGFVLGRRFGHLAREDARIARRVSSALMAHLGTAFGCAFAASHAATLKSSFGTAFGTNLCANLAANVGDVMYYTALAILADDRDSSAVLRQLLAAMHAAVPLCRSDRRPAAWIVHAAPALTVS